MNQRMQKLTSEGEGLVIVTFNNMVFGDCSIVTLLTISIAFRGSATTTSSHFFKEKKTCVEILFRRAVFQVRSIR